MKTSSALRNLACLALSFASPVALPLVALAADPAAPAGPSAAAAAPGAGGVTAQKAAPRAASAQPGPATPPPAPLPPPRAPDAVIADIVAALGGAPALQSHKSVHTKMEITFKGLGITGSAERWATTGDKTLTVTSIPSVATSREGSDGKRVWSESPIDGLRVLEGPEAEQARIDAIWNLELRMKEVFAKIEVKNEWADKGQLLECLVLTDKSGHARTDCYDAKTHLMALQRGVRSGPQGDMPYTARLSDWRAVGDIKMAHATEMQVGPMAFMGRVLTTDIDGRIDPTMFVVPRKPTLDPGGTEKTKAKPVKTATPAKTTTPAKTPSGPTPTP